MSLSTILLSLSALISIACAKHCMNFALLVEISARQGVFDVPNFQDDYDVCSFMQNFTSISGNGNYTSKILTGYATVARSYNISAELCRPDNGTARVVQILSHGAGFDKTYWHVPVNSSEYSYVDMAVDGYGYATLSYDRLGIGNSSQVDPINVAQAPVHVEVLRQINTMVRNGSSYNQSPRIVNVGHSFGAQVTHQLASTYPDSTDAIILQGYSLNSSFFPQTISSFHSKVARLNQPLRFGNDQPTNRSGLLNDALNFVSRVMGTNNETDGLVTVNTTELLDFIAGFKDSDLDLGLDYPNNYLTWSDEWAHQYNFFYAPYFDRSFLSYIETIKQPFAVGELLTIGPEPFPSAFTGPVQIITGNQDAIYCGGDCSNTGNPSVSSIPEAARPYFSNSTNFEVYVQPNTGHCVNFHYNATGAYRAMLDFLERNGLTP